MRLVDEFHGSHEDRVEDARLSSFSRILLQLFQQTVLGQTALGRPLHVIQGDRRVR